MSDGHELNSIAAAARLARSSRLRALLAWIGALLLPLAGGFAGYVGKSIETRSGYELLRAEVAATRSELSALRGELATAGTEGKVLAIGAQAAYATAGFQAYEAARLKAQKQAWAKNYADSYTRLVKRDGLSPEAAYALLFKEVAAP